MWAVLRMPRRSRSHWSWRDFARIAYQATTKNTTGDIPRRLRKSIDARIKGTERQATTFAKVVNPHLAVNCSLKKLIICTAMQITEVHYSMRGLRKRYREIQSGGGTLWKMPTDGVLRPVFVNSACCSAGRHCDNLSITEAVSNDQGDISSKVQDLGWILSSNIYIWEDSIWYWTWWQ